MTAHDFTPSKRLAVCVVGACGVAIAAIGVASDRNWGADARYVGAILIAGAVGRWAVRPLFISMRDLYATAHQQGFDQGWHEGRLSALPSVVHLSDYREQSDPDVGRHAAAGPQR